MKVVVLAIAVFLGGGCSDLEGLGGPASALVTFEVVATGDLGPLRPAGISSDVSLQIALVWGAQWWTEPFCIVSAESDAVTAVTDAGCRDPFGFVPASVSASVPVTIGASASLALFALPSTDLLVGGISSRVGYASLVLYDDRDGDGTLGLSKSHPTGLTGRGPGQQDTTDSADIVYGASFLTMTAPDQRVAFLQGSFDAASAFYPREGCPEPPDGFSVLSAGGFSAAAGLAASTAGTLPSEDPASCAIQQQPDPLLISIAASAPTDVAEVSCTESTLDGTARYQEPPTDEPDFSGRVTACAGLPSLGGATPPNLTQLVVSGRSTDHCKGLSHYVLRGCAQDVSCAAPDWDLTGNPPSWWPCN
ncbi:MAG TPA: hypothetical protein VFG23_02970 [Polyangia bacterium]|nr:hypothetical protein [Polyangia bacterium]